MQYILSIENLKKLHASGDVTGYKAVYVSRMFNQAPTTWLYKIQNGSVTWHELIKVCNMYRIPFVCFVPTDTTPVEIHQVDESKWKDIKIDFTQFMIEARRQQNGVVKTFQAMNMGSRRWYDLSSGVTRMEDVFVKDSLAWFNTLKFNLGSFVIDPNEPVPDIPGYTTVANSTNIYDLYDKALIENHLMRQQIEVCASIIDSLRSLIDNYDKAINSLNSNKAVAKATRNVKKIRDRYHIPYEEMVENRTGEEGGGS